MTEARYILVRKDGVDVLHRNPNPECGDGAERVESIDPLTASKMKAGGYIRVHDCEEEPSA